MTLAQGQFFIGNASNNPEATSSISINTDGEVTFTKVVSGVDPTSDANLVTLGFMEGAIPGILDFYLASSTDGGTGFFDLFPDDLNGAEQSFSSSTAANTNDQLIATWISTSTLPNTLEQGKVVELHIHAEETGANANTRLYFTLATTSGAVFLTSEISGTVTSKDSFRMHKAVNSDIEFASDDSDRVVLALFANVGSGAPGEITIYFEGRTASRLEIPAPTSVLISGLLKANGSTPLTADWNAGAFNITISTTTGNLIGNADTATALVSNPTDCGAGTKAISIDASGNLTCSAVDISADTNLATSGVLIALNNDTISVNEGTMTDTKTCIYTAGTGIVCNTTPAGAGVTSLNTFTGAQTLWGTADILTVTASGTDGLVFNVPNNATTGSTVAKATALASDPNDCAGGTVARSIDASGNLTCSAVDISTDTKNLSLSSSC